MNGDNDDDNDDDDMALLSLLDRYPFNLAQIKLILKLESMLVKTEHINHGDQVNGDNSNDKANDDGLGTNVGLIKLTSLSDHPSIKWIESNLSLVRPLSDYLTAADVAKNDIDIFGSIAELTARRGSPSSSLKRFYDSVRDSSNSTRVDAEILLKGLYQIALASHVIQHWNIWNNDDNGNDKEQAEEGKSASMDLNSVKMCAMQNKGPMEMIYSLRRFQQEQQQPETNADNQNNDGIECHAFLNWVEIHFPHMNSILSTFLHLALFSTLDSPHPQEIIPGDDGDEQEEDQSTLHLYALGKRIMFQFPALSEFILATANSSSPSKDHDGHKHGYKSQLRVVGQMPAQSFFLPDSNSGGIISHLAFALSLMDTNISGKWHKLYSTQTDGFAFLNLQRKLLHYTGPTIMLIRPTEASMHGITDDDLECYKDGLQKTPGLLGVYTANPWKESNRFYGNSDCFLFRAEPMFNVYRARNFAQEWSFQEGAGVSSMGGLPVKENYMYFNPSAGHFHAGSGNNLGNGGIYGGLNSSSQHSKSGAKPQGLVVGGTEQDPRIHITESLERCIASSGGPRDATFEAGALLPGQWDKYFNVDVLEVWGVGGDNVAKEALDKKEKQADVMDATRRRVQTVDKRQFLDDFRSGFHARGTGSTSLFQHRLDGSVRHDFDVRDKEGNERP